MAPFQLEHEYTPAVKDGARVDKKGRRWLSLASIHPQMAHSGHEMNLKLFKMLLVSIMFSRRQLLGNTIMCCFSCNQVNDCYKITSLADSWVGYLLQVQNLQWLDVIG